jgi:Tfp pilus assembly protein PilV
MPGLSGSQRGCTMPEALATLLVVGAGLPGLGLLQLESLRILQEAGWQLAAVAAAADVAEGLRAGVAEAALVQQRPAGLPPGARLYLASAGEAMATTVRVRVEWPGHDALPAAFELGVSR